MSTCTLIGGPDHNKLIERKSEIIFVAQLPSRWDLEQTQANPDDALRIRKGQYVYRDPYYIWAGWLDNLIEPQIFTLKTRDEHTDTNEVLIALANEALWRNLILQPETYTKTFDKATFTTTYVMWGCVDHGSFS